jgi:hypothetical protein
MTNLFPLLPSKTSMELTLDGSILSKKVFGEKYHAAEMDIATTTITKMNSMIFLPFFMIYTSTSCDFPSSQQIGKLS